MSLAEELLLVVDLEATCWEDKVEGTDRRQSVQDMEVIEFGCVICNKNGDVIDAKSYFVRPQLHPKLSVFCTALTSIQQSDVDSAQYYTDVVYELNKWLEGYLLRKWCSWGNYDKNQLLAETERHGVSPNFLMLPHHNLKKMWAKGKSTYRNIGPKGALEYHGLQFDGNYHRAIDDALNIARLLPFITFNEQ
ncbi:MAG TPA: exonuclease domain-containing protein [Methylophaga aminisulfidivorans]|uniref:Exonuclease domain-containing protein n=2 Tax=root TaxID=1 RepID=A0A7C2ARF7_9GAMM|nr:exonuclease domain-containing protein [Methylophaga aminisulfidivorans]